MCGCKEKCKEELGNLTFLQKPRASGYAVCTTCNCCMDWRFCHVLGKIPATKESVGLYCNCCNIRVRTKPRSRKSKEIFKRESLNEVKSKNNKFENTDTEDKTVDRITPNDIHISKGQASLLKKIAPMLIVQPVNQTLPELSKSIPQSLRFEINDNWGRLDSFLELAKSFDVLNKISAIILFEKLNKASGKVITKKEFLAIADTNEEWINDNYKSWEHLLELLGYDPWYRNTKNYNSSDNIRKQRKVKRNPNERDIYKKSNQINYVSKNLSIDEINKKLNQIRLQMIEQCKENEFKDNYADYSYLEMFELLEKLLEIIPKKFRSSNIQDFL